jgi:hypothetical protein
MGKWLEIVGTLSGILGFIVAILGLLRDTFDFQLKWSKPKGFFRKILVSRQFLFASVAILLVIAVLSLSARAQDLENTINNVASIESVFSSVSAYTSDDVSKTVTNGLSAQLVLANDKPGNFNYQLFYNLPDDNNKHYANVAFFFRNSQDFSQYDYIKIVISLTDDNSRCIFDILDIDSNNIGFIEINGKGEYQSNITLTKEENTQTIVIPISDYFPEIKSRTVRYVRFFVSTDMQKGSNSFTIRDISFISNKPQ